MRAPEIANTQFLCLDSITSHGAADNKEAIVAPRPKSTKSDGNAQHSNVPSEVKSDK